MCGRWRYNISMNERIRRTTMQDYLLIGEITKPQGVQGELKLRPITCDPARVEGMRSAFVGEDGK